MIRNNLKIRTILINFTSLETLNNCTEISILITARILAYTAVAIACCNLAPVASSHKHEATHTCTSPRASLEDCSSASHGIVDTISIRKNPPIYPAADVQPSTRKLFESE